MSLLGSRTILFFGISLLILYLMGCQTQKQVDLLDSDYDVVDIFSEQIRVLEKLEPEVNRRSVYGKNDSVNVRDSAILKKLDWEKELKFIWSVDPRSEQFQGVLYDSISFYGGKKHLWFLHKRKGKEKELKDYHVIYDSSNTIEQINIDIMADQFFYTSRTYFQITFGKYHKKFPIIEEYEIEKTTMYSGFGQKYFKVSNKLNIKE